MFLDTILLNSLRSFQMTVRRRLNLSVAVFGVFVVFVFQSVADNYGVDSEKVLTADEIGNIVDLHNALRSSENASNMNYLKWNNNLATMALIWAERCSVEEDSHADHHEDDNITEFFGNIGHIVHFSREAYHAADAIREWYDQKQHFHYDSNSCDVRFSCGKYTQVVWATTQFVGCGLAFCKTMKDYSGQKMNNVYSFICNYAPSGNMVNKKPFKKGKPCSQCNSGVLTCFKGLCREDCEKDNIDCSCEGQCDNCGKLEPSSCRCLCTQGWMGPECNEPCRDKHMSCGSTPGWPAYTCLYVGHHEWDFVLKECPAMCQKCTISTNLPECEMNPCDPRNCHNGAIFDQELCRCICPKEYTGEYCRLLQSEHRIGAILRIEGPIHKWTVIWKNLLLPLTRSINTFCNNIINNALCCGTSESHILISNTSQYVTEFNIMYGTDYPILDPLNRKIYRLLIYATYWPDNTLCQTSENMEMVPQEVILSTLKVYETLISRVVQTNCAECKYLDIQPSHTMQPVLSSTATDLMFSNCKIALVLMVLCSISAVFLIPFGKKFTFDSASY